MKATILNKKKIRIWLRELLQCRRQQQGRVMVNINHAGLVSSTH